MEVILKQILNKLDTMQSDITEIKTDVAELKTRVIELTVTVNRIEFNQNEDVLSILKRIDLNTGQKDYEMMAVNKRMFHVEADIARLNDQKVG
jgi:hypothetical protein